MDIKQLFVGVMLTGFLWGQVNAQSMQAPIVKIPPLSTQERMYHHAIKDAREVAPQEMINYLWAVDNEEIPREGDSLVLVMKVISTDELPQWTGKAARQVSDDPEQLPWVSLEPELGTLFKTHEPLMDSARLTYRTKQILGLAPSYEARFVVLFWVNAKDLFRPTPNPDTYNHYSTVSYPDTVPAAHKAWMEQMQTQLYEGSSARPWTRLGYTYDWGHPERPVGVSEFVLRAGAPMRVERVASLWNWYTIHVDIDALEQLIESVVAAQ